ncbi:MFS transporter [Lysobacter niastensis]|uniref:MFS transporter n=1 Tax=Lysobacter niastensis TaxID=380629 RepID=A0ABS0B7B1_9GAMM|nr:MFS transporter [Lysobacter niastensis]MBF6024910.1 MFS transporter [Lysobacter niastensis]
MTAPSTLQARPAIPRTIWALGFVSLFTDMSSEMVHGLLPVLLAGSLGASALVIGLIEGAAEALVLIVKVFSGYISDAIGRRKPLVLLGYGLATVVKPLFPLAESVATVTTARLLDRFGKGIRGAPRDALVGDLAPPEVRGAAFGLRQSMDTVGAVLGPLLAIGLMWLLADDIRAVLWWAVVPGIVAVLLLIRLPEPDHERKPARLPLTRAGLVRLGPAFARLTALGAFLSLARFSEAFLVLRAADVGVAVTYVPLVLVVMSAVYALTAYPAGHLSDHRPRAALLAAGMAMLVTADVALALAHTPAGLFVGVALWGLHMGLNQGIVASMIADVAPAEHRGTAFGVFNLVSGLALLAASVLAGWLWDRHGPAWTFWTGAGCSALTLILIPVLSSTSAKRIAR